MGLGYGAGAGGVIVLFLTFINVLVIFAIWGGWKYYRRGKGTTSRFADTMVKGLLVLLSVFPILVVISWCMIWVSDISTDRARFNIVKKQNVQLEIALPYGEIILPKGTWVNRDGDSEHDIELLPNDARIGLSRAYFPQPVKLGQYSAQAFELHRELLIEVAQDYQFEAKGTQWNCPKGWILQLAYTEKLPENYRYQQNYTWFKPSQWQAVGCFDAGEGGLLILALDGDGLRNVKDLKLE
ncbi:hypothetical protein [Acinetobacter wuhouensis]|uniref:Uncharacterized protein n=1 Tax=Acinetobacter wuhouensis TaxID=1879050 RepID=A0A3G2T198_9GAMM|nr:hypothetical protein [Acinetobacter wuhouensis]AYO54000.1 hypothetical protein CDG68_10305 [Acinetobacter wuhouensis]